MKKIFYIFIISLFLVPFFSYADNFYEQLDNSNFTLVCNAGSGQSACLSAGGLAPNSAGWLEIAEFDLDYSSEITTGSQIWLSLRVDQSYAVPDEFSLVVSTSTPDGINDGSEQMAWFSFDSVEGDELILNDSAYHLYSVDFDHNYGSTTFVPGTYKISLWMEGGSTKTFVKSATYQGQDMFGFGFDSFGYNERSFLPTHIKSIDFPQSGDNFIDVATTTFQYTYYYSFFGSSTPVYDLAFAQLRNARTGEIRYLISDDIPQLTGTYTYSHDKDILAGFAYEWRPVLRNSYDLSVDDIVGPWISFYNFDSSSSTGPLLIDSTGYTPYDLSLIPSLSTTTGATAGFCQRLPFAYFCDIYSAIVGLDPTPLSTSTPILRLDFASSTTHLIASSTLNVPVVSNVDFITPSTLQYFIPDNVASVFRNIVLVGLWLSFGYMVWSSVSKLFSIST